MSDREHDRPNPGGKSVKVSLAADEWGGCVATLSGCGVGGHTARVLFLDPDVGPLQKEFDGDTVTFGRSTIHARVLATLVDSVTDWDVPATFEPFEGKTALEKANYKKEAATAAAEAKKVAAAELAAAEKAEKEARKAQEDADKGAVEEKRELAKAEAEARKEAEKAAKEADVQKRKELLERVVAEREAAKATADAEAAVTKEQESWDKLSDDERVEILFFLEAGSTEPILPPADQLVFSGGNVTSTATEVAESSSGAGVRAGTEVEPEPEPGPEPELEPEVKVEPEPEEKPKPTKPFGRR